MSIFPLVSIVIPTFNRAAFLKRAIESVFAQSYSNWEIVVVDDGSIDETEKVITQFADARIHYHYQTNQGVSSARNTGLQKIRGEFVAYLDSDDELCPDYLEVMMNKFEERPDALFAWCQYIRHVEVYENGNLVSTKIDEENVANELSVKDIFLRKYYFTTDGLMHRSSLLKEGIRWDTNLGISEDWDFFMQLGERYPDNFLYVKQKLFIYHRTIGMGSISTNASFKDLVDSFEYIYQKHKDDLQLQGQEWYPNRVEKYRKYEEDYQNGTGVSPLEYKSKRNS